MAVLQVRDSIWAYLREFNLNDVSPGTAVSNLLFALAAAGDADAIRWVLDGAAAQQLWRFDALNVETLSIDDELKTALLAALDLQYDRNGQAVIRLLAAVPELAENVMPRLRSLLPVCPYAVLPLLGDWGIRATPLRITVMPHAQSGTEENRADAIIALHRIGEDCSALVRTLLSATDEDQHWRVADAVIELALPEHEKLFRIWCAGHYFFSTSGAIGLARLGYVDEALPLLLRAAVELGSMAALNAIAQLGSAATSVMEPLRAALHRDERVVRSGMLGQIVANDELWQVHCRRALQSLQMR